MSGGLDPLTCPAPRRPAWAVHWGADVETAVENAVALEAVAALAYRTFALRPDQAELDSALQERHFTRKHGPTRYYGQP